MKITIITVCLNSEDTLERTIKSVIAQDYKDKEYIIVDGGSTDKTLDIIKKYENHVTKWISEPDKGIYDAMNKGISMATGDVIAFLNSDDWYQNSILSIVGKAFEENECDCVCGDNYVITYDGIKKYYDVSSLSEEELYRRMIYYHSAIFAKQKMFLKQDNFNLQYKIAADYDWILRNFIHGAKIHYLHRPLFTFCYGGVSSINEVECAKEAREIALHYLPAHRQDYLKDINGRYYEIAINAIDEEWLKNRLNIILNLEKPIILWGAGYRAKKSLAWLKRAGMSVMCILDSDENKWGSELEGVEITSPEFFIGQACNLIITPEGYSDEIQEQISKYKGNFVIYELKELCIKIFEA